MRCWLVRRRLSRARPVGADPGNRARDFHFGELSRVPAIGSSRAVAAEVVVSQSSEVARDMRMNSPRRPAASAVVAHAKAEEALPPTDDHGQAEGTSPPSSGEAHFRINTEQTRLARPRAGARVEMHRRRRRRISVKVLRHQPPLFSFSALVR